MTKLKSNNGGVLGKYNKESDSFDMIRVMHLSVKDSNDKCIEYVELDDNYHSKDKRYTLKENEFNEKFKDWQFLQPEGILILSNVNVALTASGSEIKDIIMLYYPANKVSGNIDPENPKIIARQAVNNIFKTEFDPDSNDVGFSTTEDCLPPDFTFADLTMNSGVISSYSTNVYKFDTPETLSDMLNNEDTSTILTDLYNNAIQYDRDNSSIIHFGIGAIEDDCYRGYCNSLGKFIATSGLMNDIYNYIGIVKTDFELEFNKPIVGEDLELLSILYGGISIDKAVPIKFGYDINLRSIHMSYMLIMDKNNILWIVPYTKSSTEFSPLDFYKITTEQTNKIQERLKSCVEAYDKYNKNT